MSTASSLRRRNAAAWLRLPVALLAISIVSGCGDRLAGGGGVETGNGQIEVAARLLLPDGSPAARATVELVRPVIDGQGDSVEVLATAIAGVDGTVRIRCALARPVLRARLGSARLLRSYAADSGPAAPTLVLHHPVALFGTLLGAPGQAVICVPGSGACVPVGADGRWRLDSVPLGTMEIAVLAEGRASIVPLRLSTPDTVVDAGEIILPGSGESWMPWQSPLRPGPVPRLTSPPASIEVLDPDGRPLVRSSSGDVPVLLDLPPGAGIGAVLPIDLDTVAAFPDPGLPSIVALSPSGAVLPCAREGTVLWISLDSASRASSRILLATAGARAAAPWAVASGWRRAYHLSDSGVGTLAEAVAGASGVVAWANGSLVNLGGMRLSGRAGRGLVLLPGMTGRFPLWDQADLAPFCLSLSFRIVSGTGVLFEAWGSLRLRSDSTDLTAELLAGGAWAAVARWRLPSSLEPGAWHDLAFRHDAGGATIILDGEELPLREVHSLVADRVGGGELVVSGDAISALDEVRAGTAELWPRIGWNAGTIAMR